jgi:hypothetical protein
MIDKHTQTSDFSNYVNVGDTFAQSRWLLLLQMPPTKIRPDGDPRIVLLECQQIQEQVSVDPKGCSRRRELR